MVKAKFGALALTVLMGLGAVPESILSAGQGYVACAFLSFVRFDLYPYFAIADQ